MLCLSGRNSERESDKADRMNAGAEPLRRANAGPWQIELLPKRAYEARYSSEDAVIGFAFDGQVGSHSFGGDKKAEFRSPPNGLAYVPAGCDVYSCSRTGGEYLKISRANSFARAGTPERRFSGLADPVAIASAHELRKRLLSQQPIEPLNIERLLQVLEDRVQFFLFGRDNHDLSGAWMTARRLRLIDEIIEAKLSEKITVQDLANALNLSTGFFARAFKAALGKSPHDYIIDHRIAFARSMLRASEMRLAEIAHTAGFSSHAHMTVTFQKRLGARPVDIRGSLIFPVRARAGHIERL